jgi:hypothetical protein
MGRLLDSVPLLHSLGGIYQFRCPVVYTATFDVISLSRKRDTNVSSNKNNQ